MRELKRKSLIEIPNKYIAFDIETTGLDSMYDEIGAIKIENEKEIETFNSLIKPEYEIDEFITELTGITNEMLKNAPPIDEVLPKFMTFIKDSIILGHNANFDINFIYDKLINEDRITIEIFKKLEELVENKYSTIENFKEVCKTKSHTGFKARDITTTNT